MTHNRASKDFRFVISDLPEAVSLDPSRKYVFECTTLWQPGASLDTRRKETFDGYCYTLGPDNVTFPSVQLFFVVDEDFANWKFLFNWMRFINDNRHEFNGEDAPVANGILSYYANNNVFEVEFLRLFPSDLGSIQFSKAREQEFLEAQVTFLFDDMKLK